MMVSIKGVSKKYNNIEALKNINLDIYNGDCLGLIGPNGAGKTTLIMIILGIIPPTTGKVIINGEINSKQHFVNIGKNLGVVIDQHALYEELTGIENMYLFHEIMNKNIDITNINKLLNLTKLWDRRHNLVNSYSLGMKQRLSIARALINNPSLLIMDEPLNSLDPESHKLILDLLKKLNKEKGVTVLISSHNLYDLEKICSKIAIIKGGKIIKYDHINTLTNNNKKKHVINFEIKPDQKSIESIINKSNINCNYTIKDTQLIIESSRNFSLNNLLASFIKEQINIKEIREYSSSLEEIYIEHINKGRKVN